MSSAVVSEAISVTQYLSRPANLQISELETIIGASAIQYLSWHIFGYIRDWKHFCAISSRSKSLQMFQLVRNKIRFSKADDDAFSDVFLFSFSHISIYINWDLIYFTKQFNSMLQNFELIEFWDSFDDIEWQQPQKDIDGIWLQLSFVFYIWLLTIQNRISH